MRSDLVPSITLAVGAGLWGLYWIPIRGIEAAGVDAIWTGPVIFAASAVLLIPLAILQMRVLLAEWRHILLPGLLAGFAFALYIASLNLTEVVRAILLFYLSPVWSTLLGIVFLREKLTSNRIVALLLAFLGLYIVLVAEGGLPIPRNAGDWFALLSGICWSAASLKLFQDGARNVLEKVTLFIFCALFMSIVLVFWQQGSLSGMPGWESLGRGWYWIAVVGILMLPITWMTIWPATLLSPGRVGMLLLGEVLVGVGSAALLLDEPFGLREFSGAALIVSAGVVEVLRQQKFANSVIVDSRSQT